ncbi:MAG TPA: SGNH/GDSL hydrolase family protein [Terracidiphilus sp.]|nr:SGNH/GDSL hydrolase family protein [Terracidiphilus sp.]
MTLSLLSAACIASLSAQQFALHEGDRVAFYGDSITAQRFYTRFVEDFVLTRYPSLHVDFVNAGVPGDTVYGGYTGDTTKRLARDLFPHRPTVVTIMLGMNDGYYMPFEQKYFDVYKDGYRKLLAAIQAELPSARIMLISPTPYDEVTHGTEFAHYNETITHYAAFVSELASSSHLGFCGLNRPVSNLLAAGSQKNPSLASLLVPDHIHPSEAAHWVMAAALVQCWGASPIVSSVSIDAASQSVRAQQNTAISGLAVAGGHVAWTQTDAALPLPLQFENAMTPFVLESSDLAAMDRQIVQVKGLSASRYALSIDGHAVGAFSREDLANGINLALYPTPMLDQAKGIDNLERERTALDEARFIVADEDPKAPGAEAAVAGMNAKENLLVSEQRKEVQPKPHRFELTPQ